MSQTSARPPLCHRWHSLFFCWRLSNSVALLWAPPFWIGGELPVFVVRHHAPNRDACTVTVRYEYMYRATPTNRHFLLDEGPSPTTQPCQELLVVPANPSFHHNFTIQLDASTITPSKTARNLDDKLNFSDHVAKTARFCRFALYNIKKIRSFLSEHASQLLVQALVLSRLDYYNALLAVLSNLYN